MMRSLAPLVALGASALLTAGALAAPAAGTATPESAATSADKRFNFVASAYGTRVYNPDGDLVDSGRTAWSFVACTSETGKDKTDHLAQVDLPGDLLEVSPVTTRSRSVKLAGGVKSVANTKVGEIRLGAEGLGSLHIEGLSGTSESR
ncbi:MAG: choice-of-anchor P family protein, partial [Nocardioidaceae bacterium]